MPNTRLNITLPTVIVDDIKALYGQRGLSQFLEEVQSASQDCAKCHDWTPKYCEQCHKQRPASHAGNWKTGHAPQAKARGNGCLVCHKQAFCKECH